MYFGPNNPCTVHERARARAFVIGFWRDDRFSRFSVTLCILKYIYIYIGLSFSYRKSHVCALSVSLDIIIIIYYRRLANTVYTYVIHLVTLFIMQVHEYYYYCMYNICAADSDWISFLVYVVTGSWVHILLYTYVCYTWYSTDAWTHNMVTGLVAGKCPWVGMKTQSEKHLNIILSSHYTYNIVAVPYVDVIEFNEKKYTYRIVAFFILFLILQYIVLNHITYAWIYLNLLIEKKNVKKYIMYNVHSTRDMWCIQVPKCLIHAVNFLSTACIERLLLIRR